MNTPSPAQLAQRVSADSVTDAIARLARHVADSTTLDLDYAETLAELLTAQANMIRARATYRQARAAEIAATR